MLKKLLKYDLLWKLKIIAIFCCLGFIFFTLGMLLSLIKDSVIFSIIAGIFKGACVAMFANALFNSLFTSWARNVSNLYKDESYLTHTLPVTKNELLASKVLSQTILIVATGTLLILSIFVMYINKDVFESLKTLIQFTSEALNTSVAMLLITFLLLVLLELLFIAFCGNFGIIFGHRFNKYKTLKSVIYAILAYFIQNSIILILLLFVSIFDKGIYNLFFTGTTAVDYSSLMITAYICIGAYLVSGIALYILTNKIFNKGVNVD